jgi:hypothetical protein
MILRFFLCWIGLSLTVHVKGQGGSQPITIGFDGAPIQTPGTAALIQHYTEAGLQFTPIGPLVPGNSFIRMGSNPPAPVPDNGTGYLQAALGNSLMFTVVNGTPFDLLSVDLAEYSTVVPNAVTVQFVGYFAAGGTITTTRTTDGIIDGTGPLVDFQTFTFSPKDWTGLTRVEIPTFGWSLDNVMVRAPGVPEPSASALLLLGLPLLAWFSRVRRRG